MNTSASTGTRLRIAVKTWPLLLALVCCLSVIPATGSTDITQTYEHQGRSLQLLISAQFKPPMQENIRHWVDFISQSLLTVYGHWPREHWQIVVKPASSAASDPIPWAQVHRGGVDSVEFFVTPRATTGNLNHAWTAYHELSHLLIPYRGWGDTWFSEGLASYYQNILQARSGIIDEQQMWQNFYNGFQRGRADPQFNNLSLDSVSQAMRDKGGYMRVYWSGAWYFLTTDIRLRRQSAGSNNLDLALSALNHCCADQRLSVPDMVSRLDTINKVLLFQPQYDKIKASTEIPPVAMLFASLGITLENGVVQLQTLGPGARLRQQIIK